ncbi:GTP-binding protein ERG [Beta vulgaris subsp. vulgaris]|uniref:GTP-binding protein ERG n=1 Tax=Beta vulgaris subsp. vulgaris TaxID=3555 RepID=UPI002036911B|nr:GTP-binding protein ERG [Beta vulgaris subsp. vulgaris]
MKSLKILRNLSSFSSKSHHKTHFNPNFLCQFFSAQSQLDHPTTSISSSENETDNESSTFDSSHFTLPIENTQTLNPKNVSPTWDKSYRDKAKSRVFGEEVPTKRKLRIKEKEEEEEREAEEKRRVLARALLEAALEAPDEEDEEEEGMVVKVEDQKSLSVGIIGAPNAGKSALTNYMVGTKVSAVSRKTNTTTHEVLGVMTKGDTQICFFDTPGLMLKKSGHPSRDTKARIESAWNSVNLYDVLIIIFDVHRHLTRPDSRVTRLIQRMGSEPNIKQKRILCMNKVDLVEKKKDLLKVSEELKDLQGYERIFMISGLKGSGVKDLSAYLMEQAVERPWDEDPFTMSEEVMKNISLEVVRERLLDHVHQEIPYEIDHRLVDWKDLRDGSLRIEQHLITGKESQRRILVGKNGSKIGRIGMEANEQLRSIFKRNVHLILQVRLK